MSKWTIEDQENVVKASLTNALFLSVLVAVFLLEDLTLHWFGLVKISDAIGVSVIFPLIYFIRQFWKQPKILSYGWRLRELCGDFQDEYLRSHFQRATTLAFQLMMLAAAFGFVGSDLVIKYGDPSWISYKMVPLFTVLIGNLSFYLSLRHVLDEQDDSAELTDQAKP